MHSDDNGEQLATTLRAARNRAGLSLRLLSEQSGVPKTTIVRLESGSPFQPKPGPLLSLARSLELSASELFKMAGIPAPVSMESLPAMLRSEYDLPPHAIEEIQRRIEEVARRHRQIATEEEIGGRNEGKE